MLELYTEQPKQKAAEDSERRTICNSVTARCFDAEHYALSARNDATYKWKQGKAFKLKGTEWVAKHTRLCVASATSLK